MNKQGIYRVISTIGLISLLLGLPTWILYFLALGQDRHLHELILYFGPRLLFIGLVLTIISYVFYQFNKDSITVTATNKKYFPILIAAGLIMAILTLIIVLNLK